MAISDCLNFGSPEDPAVMWQFAEACRGLKDACLELGIPVTGGNVSLYNQTGETAILPTPVVAVLGVIEDVTRRTPTGFGATGDRVLLLGETREELSGSEWAHVMHDHLGGVPPRVDLAAERSLSELLVAATGVLSSAHDVSDGGLAQTLVESALRHGVGARVDLTEVAGGDAFLALFSESAARVVVTVAPEDEERLFELAAEHGVPITSLGETRGDSLAVSGVFDVPIEELRTAWTLTLPAALA
jgi:phosphoribosylformylglycinamidine synthase